MKSTFFHVGVNRTMARKQSLQEPQINPDGSIPFIPLPNHRDPDFENLTYGDPFGRLKRFEKGDIAWFIESGTLSRNDWGYYLIAYYVIEDIYSKEAGAWNKHIKTTHRERITRNAHELRGDLHYDIILGGPDSCLLYANPPRISKGETPLEDVKTALGLTDKSVRGYWFKRWFQDNQTLALLGLLRK